VSEERAGEPFEYAYDAVNRLASITRGSGTSEYLYDAGGIRVQKRNADGTRLNYLGPRTEIDNSGNTTSYFFAGNTRIGIENGKGVVYNIDNHLGSASLLVDSAGTVVQKLDYYPFGSERVNVQAGEFATRHTFTDHESDGESGLIYANARYYHPVLGRFLAVDPASRDNPRKFLQDPQQLNGYSYVRNNPLNFIDPEGLFTVVVPGTGYDKDDWSNDGSAGDFINSVGETFGEPAEVFHWSGNNNKKAREAAANNLANQINNHNFDEGEQLNIVGHSHGGNIGILASQMTDKKIDNLVTLATPVRRSYRPNYGNIGNHINVYNSNDSIQKFGGGLVSRALGYIAGGVWGYLAGSRFEFGPAGRTFSEPSANIDVASTNKEGGIIENHSFWQDTSIWSKVDESLK